MCPYLVGEVSDLQSVGLATVGEVQAVVTFGGEQAVLEALLGDLTGEGPLQRQLRTRKTEEGPERHRQPLAVGSRSHTDRRWGRVSGTSGL